MPRRGKGGNEKSRGLMLHALANIGELRSGFGLWKGAFEVRLVDLDANLLTRFALLFLLFVFTSEQWA